MLHIQIMQHYNMKSELCTQTQHMQHTHTHTYIYVKGILDDMAHEQAVSGTNCEMKHKIINHINQGMIININNTLLDIILQVSRYSVPR